MLLHSSRVAEAVSKEAGLGGNILKGVQSVGKKFLTRAKGDVSSLATQIKGRNMVGPMPKGQARGIAGWKPKTLIGKAAKNPMITAGLVGGAAVAGGATLQVGRSVARSMKTPTQQALMQRRVQGFRG